MPTADLPYVFMWYPLILSEYFPIIHSPTEGCLCAATLYLSLPKPAEQIRVSIPCQAQVTGEGWPVAAVQEEKGILMGVAINRGREM